MSLKNIELCKQVELSQYTTIKIGGAAKYFFHINTRDELAQIIKDSGPEVHLLGKGSNLLVSDKGVTKPVIQLGEDFNYIKPVGYYLEVGAATPLPRLLHYCLEQKLAGFSPLAGIPATIGGLLCMNASSFGATIADLLSEVQVMDFKGQIKTIPRSQIQCYYRSSSLQEFIIIGARFIILHDHNVRQSINSFLKKRLSRQDFTAPSCGCIFKNPPGTYAGLLIETCGLKGYCHAGAQISRRHANFIINVGGARYNDVDYLIRMAQFQVFRKFNVCLQEEIKRWS